MIIFILIWLVVLTLVVAASFSRETNTPTTMAQKRALPFLPKQHAEFVTGNRVEEIFRNNQNASIDDVLA